MCPFFKEYPNGVVGGSWKSRALMWEPSSTRSCVVVTWPQALA